MNSMNLLAGLSLILGGISLLSYGLYALAHWLEQQEPINAKPTDLIARQILALLPQTQCAQCTYPGCTPYAAAVASGEAHNKCPPGGQTLVDELSLLLNRSPLPLASADSTAPGTQPIEMLAVIREADCIGCAKCIPACPVDAIVGANKLMHTVILTDCTGCELCLAPCPVDCIDLVPRASLL